VSVAATDEQTTPTLDVVQELACGDLATLLAPGRTTDQLSVNERLQIVDYARIAALRLYLDGKIGASGTFPVDAYAAIEKLGIEVQQADIPHDTAVNPPRALAGLIYKDQGERDPHILVQKGLNPQHQVFTACHELGHYLFWRAVTPSETHVDAAWGDVRPDHDEERFNDKGDDNEDMSPSEYAANTFAHMLLMPDAAVVALLQEGRNVAEMADFFGVTEKSARRRLSYFDVGSQTY